MATEAIKQLLKLSHTIAIVGLSDKPHRASYQVADYMQQQGYKIIPVNPMLTSKPTKVLGETAYANLLDIPYAVDMVNIFQRSEKVAPFVDDAIAIKAQSIWMQLDIINQPAANKAAKHGLDVIMDKCLKIEHQNYC